MAGSISWHERRQSSCRSIFHDKFRIDLSWTSRAGEGILNSYARSACPRFAILSTPKYCADLTRNGD